MKIAQERHLICRQIKIWVKGAGHDNARVAEYFDMKNVVWVFLEINLRGDVRGHAGPEFQENLPLVIIGSGIYLLSAILIS